MRVLGERMMTGGDWDATKTRETKRKKGLRDVHDVSWATGKFYFIFSPFIFVFMLLLTHFFRY